VSGWSLSGWVSGEVLDVGLGHRGPGTEQVFGGYQPQGVGTNICSALDAERVFVLRWPPWDEQAFAERTF
jgi:hypothetical protein